MESPDYMESPMETEDVPYPCKGCGIILEEGKAFELGGNRWHLDCFRCNLCDSLLDSDANLLLLGDGSLICNNCTYSCSACGNKIEDLAILTGDKAYCATCFRCRNCKRKIENLRYARTSHGIFCMSCHETVMARRRKKSKASTNKSKDREQSTPLVEKSLPALPPSAILSAFQPAEEPQSGYNGSSNTTELSPRPRAPYNPNSSSRSSSRRPRSPDRSSEMVGKDTALSSNTHVNRRGSGASRESDVNGDGEGFFIPLALDPSPVPTLTPRSAADNWQDKSRSTEQDYFNVNKTSTRARADSERHEPVTSPHIGFQEKGRQPSSDYGERDSPRKHIQAAANGSAKNSPALTSESRFLENKQANGKLQPSSEKFRLQEVPKNKRSPSSRSNSVSETPETDQSIKRRSVGKSNVLRKEAPARKDQMLGVEKVGTPRSSQESKVPDDVSQFSNDSTNSSPPTKHEYPTSRSTITRKEVPISATVRALGVSSPDQDTPPSSASSPDTPNQNSKSISGPLLHSPEISEDPTIPSRALNRPAPPQAKLSDSYMQPRNAPQPPTDGQVHTSPKLPRWSAGGDFTMDEDMARIMGADGEQHSLLRRVSNAVRHGRNGSETSISGRAGHARSMSETTRTTASPRWPKSPMNEDDRPELVGSVSSPTIGENTHDLRRQLRNSEQRVAELERQFSNAGDLKNLNKRLLEKRKTVSVLDSQAEIMIRQIEVLAGFVEKAKDGNNQPLNMADLEDSAIKEFVQKLERLKQSMSGAVQVLYEERDGLMEEKMAAVAERDRALMEFEQLANRNAQLTEMNNDLTHQIQEKFKTQSGMGVDSPRTNGLGIYTHHSKEKSSASVQLDEARPFTGTTAAGSVAYVQDADGNLDSGVVATPHVVNLRKGQVKKFNWKKGGQSVAKGVSKGFKGAFSSSAQPQPNAWPGPGDNIGLPYNMTVVPVEAPVQINGSANAIKAKEQEAQRQGFGLFKKSATMPKSQTNGAAPVAEHPAFLFGSELVDRADFERRQIPSIVTRCIEEVELRGMDVEGIYRKTGGNSQVKAIQEGFDKTEDYDISDPDLDITAVTSVLKQYFRKLPTPLLTYDVYDRVLESTSIADPTERCNHLRQTFGMLPPKHRDCLEFLIFHLARVAQREKENLMSPKNLAVVFAPTIMRDHNIEREMTDMHCKNQAVQFIIENTNNIFGTE